MVPGKFLSTMHVSYPISTKLNIQLVLATVGLLYIGMPSSNATPQVNLIPSDVVYFSNEGSLTLSCTVDQDVRITSVTFKRDSINYVGIFNPTVPQCNATKFLGDDTSVYSVACDQDRNFTLIKHGTSADNHRKKWMCVMNSLAGGPCVGGNNPCLSRIVTSVLQVPVATVQLMNGSGQTLSSSVNIVQGQSTAIICSTASRGSRPRATFQWYIRQGNQSPVLIVDQSISPTPDPITVPGQPEPDLLIFYSTWTLTGNESYQDMYIYCQAQDEINTGNYTKSDEVQLNIVYPPVVLLSTYQSTYNVTEGMQNFVFTCNIIEANPLPQANSYSWFHKASIIQGRTSSSYTLPSVQRADAGEYKCTARNDYGAGTSDPLYLNVQYPPDVTVMLISSSMQNQTAILRCEAWGDPAETTFYPWVHMWEGLLIRMGLQGKNNSTHSVLILDRLSLESMGTYVCTASNGIMGISGKLNQTGSGSLHVKGLPLKVQRFYFNRFIDDQIELHFDAGFNGGPEQIFVIEYMSEGALGSVWKNTSAVEIRETDNQYRLTNGTFFIKVTTPSPGSYIYRMYSWNVKGRSPFSDSIMVIIHGGKIQSTNERVMNPVPAIAGGVSGGFVVILIVTIGVFLWKRNRHPQVTEQVITLENNRNASLRPTDGDLYEKLNSNANSDIQMYSSLNVQTPSEAITLENNRNANVRPTDGDLYEKLNSTANSDVQMYSSLNIQTQSKDHHKYYENI